MNRITIKEVAKEAEVSIATVSHVINETRYVSPELTDRVERAMEKLGYKPNAVARSLKTEKTQTIGLIVSDISNPFFSSLLRGAEDHSMENDHSLIVCNTDETLAKEQLYVDILMQKSVDGLIIAPTGKSDENLKRLVHNNISFVFVDRRIEDIDSDAVLSENKEGAYRATKHLLELGHRRIGLILGLQSVQTSGERFAGYKAAITEYGIDVDENIVKRGNSKVKGSVEAVEAILSMSDKPTAIFSTNNLMTIGAMRGIKNMGYRCPEDISLVGFDDYEWSSTFAPALTTVAQKPYKIGATAAEVLFERMTDREKPTEEIRIPVEFLLRDSTKETG